MEQMKVKDIAKHLGLQEGTVMSRLDAGREKMREGIEKTDEYTKCPSVGGQILKQ
jgi:DNA-directed RNA polymerase specialized sigma24 family protein